MKEMEATMSRVRDLELEIKRWLGCFSAEHKLAD